jgi:hypothetical protein
MSPAELAELSKVPGFAPASLRALRLDHDRTTRLMRAR